MDFLKGNGKKNIAVIFGGCSTEYSISLESAEAVISHMDLEAFNPVMVGISRQGEWFLFRGEAKKISANTWCNPADCIPVMLSSKREEGGLVALEKNALVKIPLHGAFPVMHGKNGEDGTIQGALELAGIPVVGCSVLASALCMDKYRAHNLASAAGVLVPKSFLVEKNMPMERVLKEAEKIHYPLFVKPVRSGSSYGISKVLTDGDLPEAVKLAFEHDERVIVEEAIAGFEVGCAVMGNEELVVGVVDEIEIGEGFFNFKEKYSLETASIHLPARVSPELTERIKATAKNIYRTLDCRGFARVDMFLRGSKEIIFNEVNTIPGFTAHSRFPNMMRAAGVSLSEIISKAIALAVGE